MIRNLYSITPNSSPLLNFLGTSTYGDDIKPIGSSALK